MLSHFHCDIESGPLLLEVNVAIIRFAVLLSHCQLHFNVAGSGMLHRINVLHRRHDDDHMALPVEEKKGRDA